MWLGLTGASPGENVRLPLNGNVPGSGCHVNGGPLRASSFPRPGRYLRMTTSRKHDPGTRQPFEPARPADPSRGAATPDVEENRLAAVRQRLGEGYYQRPEVLEKLTEALGPKLLPTP